MDAGAGPWEEVGRPPLELVGRFELAAGLPLED